MDLTKDDLIAIERALTRERWGGEPVRDLLLRVRIRLLKDHNHTTPEAPNPEGFKVTPPVPKGDGWPELKAASDAPK